MINKLRNVLAVIGLFLVPHLVLAQAPNLGSAGSFVLFTTVGAVTNSGIPHLTHLTGNVGSNSGSSTGFGNVDGVMHDGDGASIAAAAALLLAYDQLNTAIPTFSPSSALGNGDTLLPGVYHISSAATLNGNLVLNGQGDPSALFIFQIQGGLSTTAASKVKLINGAVACNVFWKVEGLVSMATATSMKGNIVAHNAAIDITVNDTLEGRALAINGAITTNAILAYMPLGCASPVLTGPVAPPLVSVTAYGILSGNGPVTNTGITEEVGDIGTNSGLTTGFDPLLVTGTIHPSPDASTAVASSDLTGVYNYLNTLPVDINLLYPAQFGFDLVLTPHTYHISGAINFTGNVYLNAEGNTNAVFVLQVNGALSTGTSSKVILMNGAQAKNVYWKVDGAVHIFDNSFFNGTLVAAGMITLNANDTIRGRVLTISGAIDINGSDISLPADTTCTGPAIGGVMTVCAGSTTQLTDSDTTGTWSSTNIIVATVDTTGRITGVTAGTTTISYILASGCVSTAIVTVNPSPSIILGPDNVCVGSTITLSDLTAGGSWTSSNISQATVGTGSGVVTGVSDGAPVISYTITNGCAATRTIFVGRHAGVITGPSPVCLGSTITLTDTTTGGVWSASNTNATVVSGIVTGVSAGVDTVMYIVTNICGTDTALKIVTVDTVKSAGVINGASSVCVGMFTVLTDTQTGGIWKSSNARATVFNGVVTGVSPGLDTIKYSITNACGTDTARKIITINPLPDEGAISGASSVCVGSAMTLSDAAPGGTWSITNAKAGLIPIGTIAIISGVSAGLDTVKYTVSNSCGTATATKTITVNPLPQAGTITGPSVVCVASTITLTDPAAGGIWSARNTNASVLSGVVLGVTAGTDTILYRVTNVCGTDTATKIITVNPLPDAGTISGPSNVCIGSPITVNDAAPGGTWSISNANAGLLSLGAIAIVTGITPGIDTVMFTVVNSCGADTAMKPITVTAQPQAGTISGPSNVCVASSITLTDPASGGTWSASNTSALVLGGTTFGITGGIDTIFYMVTNICGTDTASKIITVDPLPNAGVITGPSAVCVGSTIVLTDGTPGGTWSSSNASANVFSGFVTGITAGVDTIRYTFNNVCGTDVATQVVTINPLPDAGTISGPSAICVGSSATFSDASAGGTWSASNANAVVLANLVTGITPGFDTITYTVSSLGCQAETTKTILINPLPYAGNITGPSHVCAGSAISLTDNQAGGSWSVSNTTASVLSGVVTGITPGNDTVMYTVTNVCGTDVASSPVTIYATPSVPMISTQSLSSVCTGTMYQNFGSATLPDAGTTYNWSATNAAIWAQGGAHQYSLVNFNEAGIAYITLTATSTSGGCIAQTTVTVNVSTSVAATPDVVYFNSHFVCLPSSEDSYQWGYDNISTLDSSMLPGQINQDYLNGSPDFGNKYYWVMTTTGGCAQKTYYLAPTAVENVNTTTASINVYPNPANDLINVEVNTAVTGQIKAEVYNMVGQKLSTGLAIDKKATINVASLPSGSYVIVCYLDGTKIGGATFTKN